MVDETKALSQLCAVCSPDRRKESANLCYRDFTPIDSLALRRGLGDHRTDVTFLTDRTCSSGVH
jgi:hypothetical protein